MVKNIIIAVLAIIIVASVVFAQSQSLEALSVNEQLEMQVKEAQRSAEEQKRIAEAMTERLRQQEVLTDSLRQALYVCK
ncbi:MAG: hypothetical protein R8G66_04355 [Cytophagales bacterium]|nr:hypothetical protein [Cytophagales bacterium]